MRAFASILALLLVAAAPAAQELDIQSVNGTGLEARGVEQLRRIIDTWDIDRWIFVDEVRIETGVIPHSHPVLTLSTQSVDDDPSQLATFIHENFHWFVMQDQSVLAAAIADHRELYPDAPGREGGGARDVDSTYLHLVVCDLEYRAMIELVGEERARDVLEGWNHYPWIYERVLSDPRIHEINVRHGLVPPD